MVVTGFDVNGALNQAPLEAQLQANLNIVPAHAWYALPSGAITFVNERTADYLVLPKDQRRQLWHCGFVQNRRRNAVSQRSLRERG